MRKVIYYSLSGLAVLLTSFFVSGRSYKLGRQDGCTQAIWAEAKSRLGEPPAELVPVIDSKINEMCKDLLK